MVLVLHIVVIFHDLDERIRQLDMRIRLRLPVLRGIISVCAETKMQKTGKFLIN